MRNAVWRLGLGVVLLSWSGCMFMAETASGSRTTPGDKK